MSLAIRPPPTIQAASMKMLANLDNKHHHAVATSRRFTPRIAAALLIQIVALHPNLNQRIRVVTDAMGQSLAFRRRYGGGPECAKKRAFGGQAWRCSIFMPELSPPPLYAGRVRLAVE